MDVPRRYQKKDLTLIGGNTTTDNTVLDCDHWNGANHVIVIPTEQVEAIPPEILQAMAVKKRRAKNGLHKRIIDRHL